MSQAIPNLHDVLEASLEITRQIYVRDGSKLAARNHGEDAAACFAVALAIKTIMEHPGAVTMLCGRVDQFMGGEQVTGA
jgi:hypothetical protein